MNFKQKISTGACLLSLLLPLQSAISQEAQPATASESAQATSKPVAVTPYQQAILNALMYMGTIRDIEKGVNNVLLEKYPGLFIVAPEKISKDYDNNEFKADKTYNGKWLLVEGRVKSVKNYSDGPTLNIIPLDKTYPTVKAVFQKTKDIGNKMADLDTEETITMICQGAPKDILPTMKNCAFFIDEVNAVNADGKEHLLKALSGEEVVPGLAEPVLAVLQLEQALGPENEKICEKGPEYCSQAINSLEKFDESVPQHFYDLGYTDEMIQKK